MTMVNWIGEHIPAVGYQSMLHTVTAAGHKAAWAFGIAVVNGQFATLVFHRSNQGWEHVKAPQIGRINRAITITEDDVWAVGDGASLRWDGTRWQRAPTANLEDIEAQLLGLTQFGGADVWAAGYAPDRDSPGGRGTVQRWDGTAWTELLMPAVATDWELSGIDGTSHGDLWTVGQARGRGLALHWDGQEWQQAPVPMPKSGIVNLLDVAALAANDVWAAGYRTEGKGDDARTRQPFAVHWDGAAWSPGKTPTEPGQISEIVRDGTTVYGIGYASAGGPWVAVLDGSTWRPLPGPDQPPATSHTTLHGGTILSDRNLLVVGASSASPDTTRPFAAILPATRQP
jgi:hypothetical protein